jgi:hypothetical protein
MKKFFLYFTAFLVLFGCAPTVSHLREPGMETFDEVLKSVTVGRTSKADIQEKFGLPTTKTYFSSGVVQWKYFYSRRWVYEQYRHLGTYGVMDKVICYVFDRQGILIEFSYEETPG